MAAATQSLLVFGATFGIALAMLVRSWRCVDKQRAPRLPRLRWLPFLAPRAMEDGGYWATFKAAIRAKRPPQQPGTSAAHGHEKATSN